VDPGLASGTTYWYAVVPYNYSSVGAVYSYASSAIGDFAKGARPWQGKIRFGIGQWTPTTNYYDVTVLSSQNYLNPSAVECWVHVKGTNSPQSMDTSRGLGILPPGWQSSASDTMGLSTTFSVNMTDSISCGQRFSVQVIAGQPYYSVNLPVDPGNTVTIYGADLFTKRSLATLTGCMSSSQVFANSYTANGLTLTPAILPPEPTSTTPYRLCSVNTLWENSGSNLFGGSTNFYVVNVTNYLYWWFEN
jgi:hypothetical protein